MVGMPKMQEQFFGDDQGWSVCRKCRSNFSAMAGMPAKQEQPLIARDGVNAENTE
jgi:hypothetical protein